TGSSNVAPISAEASKHQADETTAQLRSQSQSMSLEQQVSAGGGGIANPSVESGSRGPDRGRPAEDQLTCFCANVRSPNAPVSQYLGVDATNAFCLSPCL